MSNNEFVSRDELEKAVGELQTEMRPMRKAIDDRLRLIIDDVLEAGARREQTSA